MTAWALVVHCDLGIGCRRKRRGYTILELVLVLAILATILAATAPSLSGFAAGRKAEESAARFLATTHLARTQAITEGAEFELVVDEGVGQWWVRRAQGASASGEVQGAAKKLAALEEVTVQAEVAAVDGEQVIRFDPTGRSSVGRVVFTGRRSSVAVVCDAPLERFRIVPQEAQ